MNPEFHAQREAEEKKPYLYHKLKTVQEMGRQKIMEDINTDYFLSCLDKQSSNGNETQLKYAINMFRKVFKAGFDVC